jgi:hypothetical protein
MMCTLCGLEMADAESGCNRCGGAPTDTGTQPPADPRLIAATLAEANLARMRANWEEAEARCIDVMRKDPNNLEAHSLLGDLFRDQDRLDDAAQWYRLALDINGNSNVDRAKLKSVEREINRRAGHTGPLRDQPSLTGEIGTQRLLGASPVTWVRVLTIVSVLFVIGVGIVLLALGARPHRTTQATRPVASTTGGPAIAVPRPVTPAPRPGPIDLVDQPDGARVGLQSAMTPHEMLVRQQLARSGVLGETTSVVSIAISPGAERIDVVLLRPSSPAAATDTVRTAVLHDASAAARALLATDDRIRRVGVAVRLRTADGHVISAFEGTTDRQAMAATPESSDATADAAAFPSPSWAPDLAPQSTATPYRLPSNDGNL